MKKCHGIRAILGERGVPEKNTDAVGVAVGVLILNRLYGLFLLDEVGALPVGQDPRRLERF